MVQRFRFRRDVFFEEFSREFSLLNALEMSRGTNTNTTDQNREDDDEYDDTESNDKHERRTATARHPEHSASMCIAFTTRNEDLRRRRRKRGNAAKMRISAKSVLFLRILRLLVVARVVARAEFRRCVSLVFRIFWSEAFCVTFIHTKG